MNFSPLRPRQTVVLAKLEPDERRGLLTLMTPEDLLRYDADFESWLHEGQRPPSEEGWRTWLMMAGRGYGKTRAGAEWITSLATKSGRAVRIALVGATEEDVRKVMVEGPAGLLAVGARRGNAPVWEPSLGRLRWRCGSEAHVFSGENPDKLRGPEHHFAWCDELAKWSRGDEAWDNLQFGLRAGERPRALVTTTPRPIALLKRIAAQKWTVQTRGRTDQNMSLPDAFVEMMDATYGGTRIGRQELNGELIEDVEGALWTRALIEQCRAPADIAWDGERFARERFRRLVVAVDPPAGASATSDACGIVAVGIGEDDAAYVVSDDSVQGLTPDGWARAVADAYWRFRADLVVAEANNGGRMVETVLRGACEQLPIRLVHAANGKAARAEPVSTLYQRGRARHAGAFPELEDELAGLVSGGGYQATGAGAKSPDRADALVWAMTELMLGKEARPRIRIL